MELYFLLDNNTKDNSLANVCNWIEKNIEIQPNKIFDVDQMTRLEWLFLNIRLPYD